MPKSSASARSVRLAGPGEGVVALTGCRIGDKIFAAKELSGFPYGLAGVGAVDPNLLDPADEAILKAVSVFGHHVDIVGCPRSVVDVRVWENGGQTQYTVSFDDREEDIQAVFYRNNDTDQCENLATIPADRAAALKVIFPNAHKGEFYYRRVPGAPAKAEVAAYRLCGYEYQKKTFTAVDLDALRAGYSLAELNMVAVGTGDPRDARVTELLTEFDGGIEIDNTGEGLVLVERKGSTIVRYMVFDDTPGKVIRDKTVVYPNGDERSYEDLPRLTKGAKFNAMMALAEHNLPAAKMAFVQQPVAGS